jgi:hypothetical protein
MAPPKDSQESGSNIQKFNVTEKSGQVDFSFIAVLVILRART